MSTVSVLVTAPVVMSAEAGLRLHVAGLVAPDGLATVQVKFTVPVKLFDGVAVITDVFPVVAPAARLRVVGKAVREKPGVVEATAASMASVCTYLPVESVPVTNTL